MSMIYGFLHFLKIEDEELDVSKDETKFKLEVSFHNIKPISIFDP